MLVDGGDAARRQPGEQLPEARGDVQPRRPPARRRATSRSPATTPTCSATAAWSSSISTDPLEAVDRRRGRRADIDKPTAIAMQFRYAFVTDADGLKVSTSPCPTQPRARAAGDGADRRTRATSTWPAPTPTSRPATAAWSIVDIETPEQPADRSDLQRRRRDQRRQRREGRHDQRERVRLRRRRQERPARAAADLRQRHAGRFGFSPRPPPKLIATYQDARPGAGDLEGPRSRPRRGRERQPDGGVRPARRAPVQSRGDAADVSRCATDSCDRSPTCRRAQRWRPSHRHCSNGKTRGFARSAEPSSAAITPMADAPVPFETRQDGSLVLDAPVELPDVLDVLIVGGGPFGTAAAFRLKELGLSALVIDYDDLMKRIRDYAKEKPILPDYGGGDRMQFPKGGDFDPPPAVRAASTRTRCACSGRRSIASSACRRRSASR